MVAAAGQPDPQGRSLLQEQTAAPDSPLCPPTRHRANVSRIGRPSTDSKRKGLRKARGDSSRSLSTTAIPQLAPLELPTLLPQQKRLSPLPDFTSYLPDNMGDLSSQPWVAVRTMAERMPSRRSSILTAQETARAEDSRQRLASFSGGRSTPMSPSFGPSTLQDVRALGSSPIITPESRKKDPVEEPHTAKKAPNVTALERSRSTPSPRLRLQSPIQPIPRQPNVQTEQAPPIVYSRTISNSPESPMVYDGPARQTSPHLSQRKPVPTTNGTLLSRKGSLTSPHGKQDVDDAVRELQDIVEAKREGEQQPGTLQRSDSAIKRLEDAKKHRPAIAPGMLVGVNSELLDDIGSAFSRSKSETPMISQHRIELQRTPSNPSHPPSSFPKRLPRWFQGRLSSDDGSPRHSGTFFVTPLSRNNSTSEEYSTVKVASNAAARDESPVDYHWTPVHSDSATVSIPDKISVNPLAVPEKDDIRLVEPRQQRPQIRPNGSSTRVPANAASHLSIIAGSEASSPSNPKSPNTRSRETTPSRSTPSTPARTTSRSKSRTDESPAAKAEARTDALSRTPSQQATTGSGLGLGIGVLGPSKDDMILNIVDLKSWQTTPRTSSLPKKPERSSSRIAIPNPAPVEPLPSPSQVRHIAAQQVARAVVVPASGPETESKERPRVVVKQLSAAKQKQKEKALAGFGVGIVRPATATPTMTEFPKADETDAAADQTSKAIAIDEITVTQPPPAPPKSQRQQVQAQPSRDSNSADVKVTGYRTRSRTRSQSQSRPETPADATLPPPPSVSRKPLPSGTQVAARDSQPRARSTPRSTSQTDAHTRTKSHPDNTNARRPTHARTKSSPHNRISQLASSDANFALMPTTIGSTDADILTEQQRGRALSQPQRGRARTPQRRQRSQPAHGGGASRVTSMSIEEREGREREKKARDFEMSVKRSASARRLREVEAELRKVERELANLGKLDQANAANVGMAF